METRSICPRCGKAVDLIAGSRFCLDCGADLALSAEEIAVRETGMAQAGNGPDSDISFIELKNDEASPDALEVAPTQTTSGEIANTGTFDEKDIGQPAPYKSSSASFGGIIKRLAAAAIAFAFAYGAGYLASGGFGEELGSQSSSGQSSETYVTSPSDAENTSSNASDGASTASEEAGESTIQTSSGDEKLKFTNDMFHRSAEDIAELREYASLIGSNFALPFTLSDLVVMPADEVASATSALYEHVADFTTIDPHYIYSSTEELYESMSSSHLYELRKTGGILSAPWYMQIGDGSGQRWGEIRRNEIAAGAPFSVNFRGNVPIEEPTYNGLCESIAQVFQYDTLIIYDYPSGAQDQIRGFALTGNAYADITITLYGGYFRIDMDAINSNWSNDDRSPQDILDYYKKTETVEVIYLHER